jgi:MerR family transcriptional regulator, aldehyde-responsive regulator
MTMNIAQAAAQSRLSVDTIRFYEKSAMLPKIARDKRGWRAFDPPAIEWLVTLERLRATGMPLKDVKRFAILANSKSSQSKSAAKERLTLLLHHQERLRERRKALDACEAYLNFKINTYRKQFKT